MAADVPEQEQGDQEESGTWSPAGHRDRGVVTPEVCAGIVLSNTSGLVELLRIHNKTFWLVEKVLHRNVAYFV